MVLLFSRVSLAMPSSLDLDVAAVPTSPIFTDLEIQKHRANIGVITKAATQCLIDTYSDHVRFYEKWKVSKYYGDRKPEHRTEALRRKELIKYGAPENLISQLEPISCIGLTIECLGKGFAAANQSATWDKIYKRLAVDHRFLGTDLQIMLIQLGWSTAYWNPDPSQNSRWDAEDRALVPLKPGRKWMPVWGGHAARYRSVILRKDYSGIPILDAKTLVGFKDKAPAALARVPFFIGTAHAGYHVFPGFGERVIEAHSRRNLNDFKNLEVSLFNPLGGGGPKWTHSEHYRSGVIVMPPPPLP
jgi:hypothetical protein